MYNWMEAGQHTSNTPAKASKGGIAKKTVIEQVPIHGPRVMETHQEISELADTLDVRIDALMKEHSKDFYLAFKAFMYEVQRDIKDMQHKADDQDSKTRSDMRIQSLESRLAWYMKESPSRVLMMRRSHPSGFQGGPGPPCPLLASPPPPHRAPSG